MLWYIRDLEDFNEVYKKRISVLTDFIESECVEIDEAIAVFERHGMQYEVVYGTQSKEAQTIALGLNVQFEPVVAFAKDAGRTSYLLESGTSCLKIGA